MKKFALVLLLGGAMLLPGCARSPQYENAAGNVADLRRMPQSLSVLAQGYAGPSCGQGLGILLRTQAEARADMEGFRLKFFQPWNEGTDVNRFAIQDSLAELERVSDKRGYTANLHPWTDMAWRSLRENADLAGLERALVHPRPQAAITVRATNLRAAPTDEARFDEVHGAGKGWPFDLFQQSALPAGLPLSVLHRSKDGAWLYVESAGIWGWVHTEDTAEASQEFQDLWQDTDLAAVVREGTLLRFRHLGAGTAGSRSIAGAPNIAPGAFLAKVGIGTVLPSPRSGEVLFPVRGLDGKACVVTVAYDAPVPGTTAYGMDDALSSLSAMKSPVMRMPLPLTPSAVASLGDRMMGQPYGWGGLNGGRDCSSMMRDLFTPFGIWLPRNSVRQAESGERISLETLKAAVKERRLLEKAQPFRTLVWMPGHVGLYVGQWKGRAAIFHNMWGVRSELSDGREGRVVVGRAVVTGLRPGAERSDMDEDGLLIERLGAFTIIGGKYSTTY